MYTARRVLVAPEPEPAPMYDYDEPDVEIIKPKRSKKGRLPGVKLLRQLAAQRKIEAMNKKLEDMAI